MSATIDLYFTTMSPWAYIGHRALLEMAARVDAAIRYRPMQLLEVFAATSTPPLAERHQTRKNLRLIELQRWRDKRGLDFVLSPAHWPFAFETADRVVIAAGEAGHDQGKLLTAMYDANWIEQRDLGDEAVLTAIADASGLDGDAILALAGTDKIGAQYKANTSDAVAAGAFGSPSYVLNGELFWGQDRLELLEDAVRSGRAPYTAGA